MLLGRKLNHHAHTVEFVLRTTSVLLYRLACTRLNVLYAHSGHCPNLRSIHLHASCAACTMHDFKHLTSLELNQLLMAEHVKLNNTSLYRQLKGPEGT